MTVQILLLCQSGQPLAWLNREQAATLYAKNRVVWEIGCSVKPMQGGYNSCGKRSSISLSAIIACEGAITVSRERPVLTNRLLFRRDGYRCMYCGVKSATSVLTRDHIIPRAQHGPDKWENVVAACKRCNNAKGARTPEQAGMPLLAVPFVPNAFEILFLANRNILADQMEYLASRFSHRRDWNALV